MSSARWIKNNLRYAVKRLQDLAGRRSHADHETQIAFAALIEVALDIPFRRHPIMWIRARMAVAKMAALHKECCELEV